MSIRLHPEKGVNPFLTYCRRCKGDAAELILIGDNDGIYQCNAGASVGGPHTMYGRPTPRLDDGDCEECGHRARWTRIGTIQDGQRLPATQPCDTCLKNIEEHKKIVEAGGVYFECEDCKASGVIKGTARMSPLVREQHQRDEEKRRKANGQSLVEGWFTKPIHNKGNDLVYVPCGLRFTKEDCPACGPDKDIHSPPEAPKGEEKP